MTRKRSRLVRRGEVGKGPAMVPRRPPTLLRISVLEQAARRRKVEIGEIEWVVVRVCLSRWASCRSSDVRRFIVQLTIAKLHCTIFLLEGLSAVVVKADHAMKTRVKLFPAVP